MCNVAARRAKILTCFFHADKWKAAILRLYIMWRVSYDTAERDRIMAGEMAGYKPNPDEVLATRKGTCWDYAALYAAMLQAVGIEARVVMGYCVLWPDVYHAWNEINDGEWHVVDIARDEKCYFTKMYKEPKEYVGGTTLCKP